MNGEELRTELAVLKNELRHILNAVETLRDELRSWRSDHELRLRDVEKRVTRLEDSLNDVHDVAREYQRIRVGTILAVVSAFLTVLTTVVLSYVR